MLYTSKIQTAAFMKALCLAVLFALAAGAPVAAGQGLCAADMRLTAGEDFLGFAGKGEVTIFEVDVPSAGYLAVEAVAPIDAPAEPKLALFDHGCAPATAGVKGVRIVERFVSGMVLKVRRPGSYFFAVAAQDPLTSLEFELVTRFVSRYAVDMVGDEEPDPDMVGDEEPDPDMVGDEEPDPDMIGTGLETKMASDLAGSLKPFVLCRSAEAKTYDGFSCATSPIRGTVQRAGTFRFVLSEQRTVAIETVGDVDVLAGLYDHRGHRLAVDNGTALRIVKTLGPGEYFVRVAHQGAGLTFTLTITALSW